LAAGKTANSSLVGLVMKTIAVKIWEIRQELHIAVDRQDAFIFPLEAHRYPIYMIMVDEFRIPMESEIRWVWDDIGQRVKLR